MMKCYGTDEYSENCGVCKSCRLNDKCKDVSPKTKIRKYNKRRNYSKSVLQIDIVDKE